MAQSIADQFGGKVATTPIKSRARALEKIVNDYGGDASRIKDLARNTIVVPADQIDSVVSALAHNGAAVKRIDAATDPLGYSGVNSSLKTKNGITGEIQVNSPEMIYAKETPKNARAILGDDVYDSISAKTGIEGGLGHKFYEQWRALPEGNQGRLPIEAQSKAYYDAIRSKTGQSVTNSPLMISSNPATGNPAAIARGFGELNTRQTNALDALPKYGSSTITSKSFGQKDLAALSAATGDEFAMFTTGGRRLIYRGDASSVPVTPEIASNLSKKGWRWSSHVHPGDTPLVLRSSTGDQAVLRAMGGNQSAILNSTGQRAIFTPLGDSLNGWMPW